MEAPRMTGLGLRGIRKEEEEGGEEGGFMNGQCQRIIRKR
jgi:hypothetical protein